MFTALRVLFGISALLGPGLASPFLIEAGMRLEGWACLAVAIMGVTLALMTEEPTTH